MPDTEHERKVAILRTEVETLLGERQSLLRAAGAAAVFVARLDSHALPESTFEAADMLAGALTALPEDTLRAAIELIRKEGGGALSRAGDDEGG